LTIAIASTRSGDRHIGGPAPVVFEAYARSEVTTTADDEARLVASLRLGDERAFTEIVDRYGSAMYRVARAYVGSDDLAGDVLQEAWLVALRSIQTFEGRSTLRTWLIGIAVNVARSRRRREARGSAFSVLLSALAERRSSPTVDPSRFQGRAGDDPGAWRLPPAAWSDRPEAQLLGKELLGEVRTAIEALPEAHRVVMQMRDVEGFASDEVARILGISTANVRVRLHRARAAVRARLETYFSGVPR
jgi:RNA polymerase sigma-70 factor (ECF subfamily)